MRLKRLLTFRAVRMFIQRGRRGWCDEDVWSVDSYINRVTGEMVKRLAETTPGYPGLEFRSLDEWKTFLSELSDDMLAWNDDSFLEHDSFRRAEGAWHRFPDYFGGYWD